MLTLPFMAARVATEKKKGVFILPFRVWKIPARASLEVASRVKFFWGGMGG